MSLYVPLFLTQEVSDRSQARRWATVRSGSQSPSTRRAIVSAFSRVLSPRSSRPDGRRLVPVDLGRPIGGEAPVTTVAAKLAPADDGVSVCG